MLALLVLAVPLSLAEEGGVAMPPGAAADPPDYYVIQTGDTLWDISNRFLGDSQQWPELWSVNEYITNPHWIYPGNRIYFHLGDSLNPPSADTAPASEPTSAVKVETPVTQSGPACGFPPVFTTSAEGVHVSSPGVISTADDLNIRGTITKSDQVGIELGEGAYVYVKAKDTSSYDCGALVGIYREQEKNVHGPNGTLGSVFRVLAVGQVIRVDDDIATVKLRDSWSEVERGDIVGDPIPVDMELDVRAPTGDLQANVVARLTVEQRLASTGETVFLDHGTDDGIKVGSSLFIVERRDGMNFDGKEEMELPDRVVGRVVVVRAEPSFSTAVVTDAARDVLVGARLLTKPNGE
jgi:hypothetical protein